MLPRWSGWLLALEIQRALETVHNAESVVLGLEPNSDGLDGAMFTCRATLTNGSQIEETIAITLDIYMHA